MFLFHFLILFEQRFVFLLNFFGEWLLFRYFRFFLRLCSRGCRRRLDRIGRKRFYSIGIIQFKIQTEMQRFIKCLAQIFGNTVNTTCMCIDDSRFPILVCTYFGIRAYKNLLPGTFVPRSTTDWMKNSSSADNAFFPVCFWSMIRSEPASVPAL